MQRPFATRHAIIWLKDGKIMLRHVGGSARRTTVAGKPVEWVILDEGDEFTVGAHRFRAEIAAAVGPSLGGAVTGDRT